MKPTIMRSYSSLLALCLTAASLTAAAPAPQANDKPVTTAASAFSTGTKGLPLKTETDTSGGSGPFKAASFTDPTLPKHTIYAPQTPPPADVKLPVIVWGNGLCAATGTFFYNFLMEVASHGFVVIANGAPAAAPASTSSSAASGGTLSSLLGSLQMLSQGMTKASDLTDSVKWIIQNEKTFKYGAVDISQIAAAGQSCGGIEGEIQDRNIVAMMTHDIYE
jgi:hypothetical protein